MCVFIHRIGEQTIGIIGAYINSSLLILYHRAKYGGARNFDRRLFAEGLKIDVFCSFVNCHAFERPSLC